MSTKKLAAAMVAALVASAALADKVTFKSGSFLTGEAGIIRDGKLAFKSADVGDLSIDIANIASLEASGDHTVQYTDDSMEKRNLSVANGVLVVNENGSVKALDMTNVKATDPEIETWHGSVNVSGTITRGNTLGESATIVADVNRRWEKDRLTANGGYYYATSGSATQEKQKTTSRFEIQAQEDHFWSTRFYNYVKGKYEFDRIMDLDYRYRIGAGLGFQWIENRDFGLGKTSFNQELGVSYIAERYADQDKKSHGSIRYAHHFIWEFGFVDGMKLTHNLEFLPQADKWEDFLLNTDLGLVYAFSANWQLIGRIEWDYRSKVGGTTKKSDTRFILGVGYTW